MKLFVTCMSIGMILLLESCTWVKPTASGAQVIVLTAEQVVDCTKAGTTHVSVLDKIGVVKRGYTRVADELETLAANSAAQLGGNAMVPISEIEDGSQSFAIYKCEEEALPRRP